MGAFSSVWLAEDLSTDPLVLRNRRSVRNLRREGSLPPSRTNSLRHVRVSGVRPLGAAKNLRAEDHPSSTTSSPSSSAFPSTRLVALKMTARSLAIACSSREEVLERDRTRVSFVREVEVLRHISHPNITSLLTHLTTPSFHVLVLPYLPGGDLLGLVNSDPAHAALTESLLRRMWAELCRAVAWMHSVGLVHRDVKLENILLTAPFPLAFAPTSGALIKLTDFGLARFIDTGAPLLSTRCGSEAYAAPELVISGRRYDARETDAWACGVVLYALCARRLPFGEGSADGSEIVGVDGAVGAGGRIGREGGRRGGGEAARRHWLMSIARGEWEWPARVAVEQREGDGEEEEELAGARLVESEGAHGIVTRLLVRDPKRRAKLVDLWDDPWMGGAATAPRLVATDVETTSPGPGSGFDTDGSGGHESDGFRGNYEDFDGEEEVEGFEDENLEEDASDDGGTTGSGRDR
ncbi:kinase-like protein [Mycena rebaudengoi]|nr:kinase-like protein [Mycena rebaudengoi]